MSLCSFEYDANGNRTQVIMPSGAVHQMEYTVTDLGAGYSPPGQTGYTNSYDLDGKLSRITLPGGRTIDNAQDSAGRITSTDYDIASINYGYSDNTTRISEISRNPKDGSLPNSISYTYDGELVTGMTIGGDASAQYAYQYDNNFNLIGITMNGMQTSMQYDADGLLTGFDTFTFDRSGPVGTPTVISDGKLVETLQYDNFGRLKSRVKTVNNQPIYKMELEYNDIGKITRKTETTGTAESKVYDYTYDPNGQLTTVALNGSPVESYAYDTNGNRLSQQLNGETPEDLTYDQQDRLQQQGGVTYQYDADGFMTQRGSDTFQYSATGELLKNNLAGGQQVAYGYDGLRRRISRTDAAGACHYLYGDPNHPFRITGSKDPAGNLTTYYYDPAGILLALERDGSRYYVATDQVGTPKAVSDQNGQIIKVLEYDSFGKIISDSNPDFYLPLSFAGGLGDQATGLVRFGLRDYSPDTGRWAARDPILFQGGQGNLYVYCGNSPIELRDPSGLKASSPCQSDSWWNDPWKQRYTDRPGGTVDINIRGSSLFGLSGGLQIDSEGNIHPYIGPSVGFGGGASITYSNSGVSHGWNNNKQLTVLFLTGGATDSSGGWDPHKYHYDSNGRSYSWGAGFGLGATLSETYIF